jgi:hypothetical protein
MQSTLADDFDATGSAGTHAGARPGDDHASTPQTGRAHHQASSPIAGPGDDQPTRFAGPGDDKPTPFAAPGDDPPTPFAGPGDHEPTPIGDPDDDDGYDDDDEEEDDEEDDDEDALGAGFLPHVAPSAIGSGS